MCGIFGYIGAREAGGIILDGLRRVEYRGYDSAGLAVLNRSDLEIRRRVGKVADLAQLVAERPVHGTVGMGHTRWATHGRPSDENAHPHVDCTGTIAVVHNGILENYAELKSRLSASGHRFQSETDTEVLAHLVEAHWTGDASDFAMAIQTALREVRGAYAVAVLAVDAPDRIVAAKHGAGSVVVGLGREETFLASDIPALLPLTRDVVILEDGEVTVLSRDGVSVTSLGGEPVVRRPTRITWDAEVAQRGGYPHFMLKEIFDQPRAVRDTFAGRLDLEGGRVVLPDAGLDDNALARFRRVVLVACGTSYHAALVGRYVVERLTGLPAEVDLGSEFRYRDLALDGETLVVALSQSGETADTLGAVRAARECGAPILAVTNVVGSALVREATGVLYTHAGPEIGVASTKTFLATLTAVYLLGVALGRARGHLTAVDARKRLDELVEIPGLVAATLQLEPRVRVIARGLLRAQSLLYVGRGIHYPIALEGALKLKELSYSHAEGHAAGEMKHGPIALLTEGYPVIALIPRDASYDRMLGNIEEARARGGRVIAVCHEGDAEVARHATHVLPVPAAADLLTPLLSTIPLQLLAYHLATLRGHDVDQPRNLAKSVTVE
jgi:glucosamine--fructose-6-phosphate aminotransferase (isomerizing)